MAGAKLPAVPAARQDRIDQLKHFAALHTDADILHPGCISRKIRHGHRLQVVLLFLGQLVGVPHRHTAAAAGAAPVAHRQGYGIPRFYCSGCGVHITFYKARAAGRNGNNTGMLAPLLQCLAQLPFRHTGFHKIHRVQYTIRCQGSREFVMCRLVGIVGGSCAVFPNKNSRCIDKAAVDPCLLQCLQNIARHIRHLFGILVGVGEQLPPCQANDCVLPHPGLPQNFRQGQFLTAGLVWQRELRCMYDHCRHPGLCALVQVFIAQHQGAGSVPVQKQQCFLKPGQKADQIFKVASMLYIAVHDQLIPAMGTHGAKQLLFAFQNGLVRKLRLLQWAVTLRRSDLLQHNLIIFHKQHLIFHQSGTSAA